MSTRSFSNFICAMLIVSMLCLAAPSVETVSAGAPLIVNSNLDAGDQSLTDGICYDGGSGCTLRAAIEQSNYNIGSDIILFADSYTINIYSPLPALTDTSGTTIKREGLFVSINGTNAVAADGLVLTSNNNKIQNLNIYNFSGNGIKITGNNNIIGMDSDGSNDAQEQNRIHSNGNNGIYVSGTSNRIAGNLIGLNDKPNTNNGIEVAGTSTIIGVNGDGISDTIEGNTVAYNTEDGIFDHGVSSIISGNTIINNQQNGIFFSQGGAGRVGTDGNGVSDSQESNRISGNMDNGIYVYDSDSITIAGNKIGVNDLGTSQHRNWDYGIYLRESNFAVIGTNGDGVGDAGEANLISGNQLGQIHVLYSTLTTIAGNKIGTDITGTAAISASQGFGIKLQGSGYSGGNISTNLISGTSGHGIQINDSDSNSIIGNTIGLDLSGRNPLPNTGNGIELVNGSTQNEVINNLISANIENGVLLNGAINNRIRGNLIGTNINGTTALGNGMNGVLIQNSRLNVIGTNSDGTINDSWSNLILGNVVSDIKIEGLGAVTDHNGIYGNRIGTTAIGRNAMPIASYGVLLTGLLVNDNYIQANQIANHNSNAVQLSGAQPTQGNSITRNSMISNSGGIYIDGAGANDIKDTDDGPNGLQNYPGLISAEVGSGTIGVTLNLNSSPSKLFNIHFYLTRSCSLSQSDSNQGETYLEFSQVTTDSNGIYTGASAVPISNQDLTKGPFLLATATSPEGSTSEFSNCIQVEGLYYWLYLPMIMK